MPVPLLAGKHKRTLFGGPLGIVLSALAAGLFLIYGLHITRPVQLLFQDELAEDPHDLLAHLLIGLLPGLAHRTALLLGIGAVVYTVLEGIEVWGLRTTPLSGPSAHRGVSAQAGEPQHPHLFG